MKSDRDTNLFASTVAETHRWLDEICAELDWIDRRAALHALRAALHVLRDRLSVEQNAHLSAQLPTLVRGIYYESWRPGREARPPRDVEAYLNEVLAELEGADDLDPFSTARAVYAVLARHISAGEVEKILGTLPHDIRILWEPAP